MNIMLRTKIISYSVLFCVLLNTSLFSITVNNGLDLSAMFSCVAGTITYSYNPAQFTKGLADNLVESLHKNSDKQNKKENEKNAAGDKKNDFVSAPLLFSNIKAVKQIDNFASGKFLVKDKDRLLTNNLSAGFLNDNLKLLIFYILLAWLAIIFRKKRDLLKNIKYIKRTCNSAV